MLRRFGVVIVIGAVTFTLVVIFILENDALANDEKELAFLLYGAILALLGNWYILFYRDGSSRK
jgi:prolipoprotein diacylglyceryltransferase